MFFVFLLPALLTAAVAAGENEVDMIETVEIHSPAFTHGGSIPSKYTCDGEDVNPPLTFKNIPLNARTLALIVDDPDAPMGMWVHWVVWNIPAQTNAVQENIIPPGAHQGKNDWGRNRYGGPCPPSGTHRYFFKLYALDTDLHLGTNTTKTDLEKAMQGHIAGSGNLMGTYKKR